MPTEDDMEAALRRLWSSSTHMQRSDIVALRAIFDRRLADCDEALQLAETATTDSDLREAIGWVIRSWEKGRVSTAALRHLQTIYRREPQQ